MATVAGIKIKAPKAKRDPIYLDEKHTGGEPVWDTERAKVMDDAVFDHHLAKSFRYYNYYFNQKDMKKYVTDWIKNHTKLSKEQQLAFIASPPESVTMTAMSLCRCVSKGMPMRERHRTYVLGKVMAAIKETMPAIKAKAKAAKNEVKAPTIQDRLNEKLAEVIGEIEGQVDNVFMKKHVDFKVYDYLATKNVAQAQIGKIRAVFLKQIDELSLAFGGGDEQLVEAYKHIKKADMKRIGDFYVKLMADLDSYAQVKKATRQAKAKKPASKDKLIAKVKYLKEDKSLKVVSINPADIIGAQAVWVFNVKTRKLGKYVADSHSGALGIKGTSIVGYAEGTSVQKTLRKPEEQLKEFAKAGKVALRTFLKDIRAVEIKLNGRLSADILILKVE